MGLRSGKMWSQNKGKYLKRHKENKRIRRNSKNDYQVLRMRFGEYEGRTFEQIPKQYLQSLLQDNQIDDRYILNKSEKNKIRNVLDNWNKMSK